MELEQARQHYDMAVDFDAMRIDDSDQEREEEAFAVQLLAPKQIAAMEAYLTDRRQQLSSQMKRLHAIHSSLTLVINRFLAQ